VKVFDGKYKKGSNSKAKSKGHTVRCFRCGRHDHLVRNCPLQKKEHDVEQFHEVVPRPVRSNHPKKFVKEKMAAWGESSDDEEESNKGEEELALMAHSEDESHTEEEDGESLADLKDQVCHFNHKKLKKFMFLMFDEFEQVVSKNKVLKSEISELDSKIKIAMTNESLLKSDLDTINDEKRVFEENLSCKINELENVKKCLNETKEENRGLSKEIKNLRASESTLKINLDTLRLEKESINQKLSSNKKELEHLSKCLKESKIKVDKSKMTVNKEKQKNDYLVRQNKRLQEKITKLEQRKCENNLREQFPKVFPWLKSPKTRNGLGYGKKEKVKFVDKKYVGMPENIICFHCGHTGHVRYNCPIRRNSDLRNSSYACSMTCSGTASDTRLAHEKGREPKWIWVPKTNP